MHTRVAGFTLLELLITLVIMTTLLAMAYPSFSGLVRKNKHNSEVLEVYQALQFARYTAISHNDLVTVCPISEGKCSEDWSQPISVFLDPLNQKAISKPQHLKRVFQGPKYNTLQPFPASKRLFQFRGTGETKGTPGRIEITLLHAAENDPRTKSKVILSWSGRPRVVRE